MFREVLCGICLTVSIGAVAGQGDLKDPTRPLEYRAPDRQKTVELHLNSILIGNGRKRAIINGQSLREGESLGSAKVLHIDPGRVVVSVQGRRRELQLNQSVRQ